jgi:protein HIRA/HIR1
MLGELSNGDARLHSNGSGGASIPIKGPLDKQIEVKTSDGRRRITPMYIPPVVEANGEWSRHSFSSERQAAGSKHQTFN